MGIKVRPRLVKKVGFHGAILYEASHTRWGYEYAPAFARLAPLGLGYPINRLSAWLGHPSLSKSVSHQ